MKGFWSGAILAVVIAHAAIASGDATRDRAEAKEHYTKATAAYDLGRYAEAAREYEAAYGLVNDPSLLFNIGQAYRFASDYMRAIQAYRSYLRRVPNAQNRQAIDEKIAELQKTLDEQSNARQGPPEGTLSPVSPAVSPAPAPPAPANALTLSTSEHRSEKPLYKRWWLWTVVGGVVVAGVAVGLGVGLAPGPSAPSAQTAGGTFSPFGK